MKRTALLMGVSLLIVAVSLAWAKMPAGNPPEAGTPKIDRGKGFGMGPGMGPMGSKDWWNDPRAIEALNLSQEQRDKLDEFAIKNEKQLIDIHAQIQSARLDLEQAFGSKSLDEAKIKTLIDRLASLRASEVKAHAQFRLDVAKILTSEQREKMKDFIRQKIEERGRFGGPKGFGPGPHMPYPPAGDED